MGRAPSVVHCVHSCKVMTNLVVRKSGKVDSGVTSFLADFCNECFWCIQLGVRIC